MAMNNEELRKRFAPNFVETPGMVRRKGELEDAFLAFSHFLNETLPEGRAKSIALTELESSLMWADKSVMEWSVLKNDA